MSTINTKVGKQARKAYSKTLVLTNTLRKFVNSKKNNTVAVIQKITKRINRLRTTIVNALGAFYRARVLVLFTGVVTTANKTLTRIQGWIFAAKTYLVSAYRDNQYIVRRKTVTTIEEQTAKLKPIDRATAQLRPEDTDNN